MQTDWAKLLQAKLLSPEDVNLRHNSTGASVEWETLDLKAQDQNSRQKGPSALRPRHQSGTNESQLLSAEHLQQQQREDDSAGLQTRLNQPTANDAGSSDPTTTEHYLTSSTTLLDQLLPWPSRLDRGSVLPARRLPGAGTFDRNGSPSPDLLKDAVINETSDLSITLRPNRPSASPKRGRSG